MQNQQILRTADNTRRFQTIGRNFIVFFINFTLLNFTTSCGGNLYTPTKSFTILPSVTNTPIYTSNPPVIPTNTPTPPSNSSVFPDSLYDLPTWISDPNTSIVTDMIQQEEGRITSNKLSFLNASTGERFEIQVPSKRISYFWFDKMHFGFLSDDMETMNLINLASGQVSISAISKRSTRLLDTNHSIYVLNVIPDPLSPNNILFEPTDGINQLSVSVDTHYSAELNNSHDERQIIVTDLETGHVIWQSNPEDGYWDNAFAWSPGKGSYIAIVQGMRDQTVDFWFPIKDTTLKVLDVITGQIIYSKTGDFGRIVWSPDGKSILHTNALSDYATFGYGFKKAPCIYNFNTGEDKCIWAIPNRQTPAGYSLQTTDFYQWSQDGKFIYFDYLYEAHDEMIGNLCIFNLLDGNISCPTEHLAELSDWNINWPMGWAGNGWSINWYNFSPNNEYIRFCASSNSLLSDDQSGPSIEGLIDIKGTKVISWAGVVFDEGYPLPRCSFEPSIWRP